MKTKIFGTLLCMLVLHVPVAAVKINADYSSASSKQPQTMFKGAVLRDANNANDSDTLREGKIQEVDFKKQTLRIHNVELKFNADKVKVFSHGHKSSITLLIPGHSIRFLLDPLDAKKHTISVVYLND